MINAHLDAVNAARKLNGKPPITEADIPAETRAQLLAAPAMPASSGAVDLAAVESAKAFMKAKREAVAQGAAHNPGRGSSAPVPAGAPDSDAIESARAFRAAKYGPKA